MAATDQKPVIGTDTKPKRKESKPKTKESHQTMREESREPQK